MCQVLNGSSTVFLAVDAGHEIVPISTTTGEPTLEEVLAIDDLQFQRLGSIAIT